MANTIIDGFPPVLHTCRWYDLRPETNLFWLNSDVRHLDNCFRVCPGTIGHSFTPAGSNAFCQRLPCSFVIHTPLRFWETPSATMAKPSPFFAWFSMVVCMDLAGPLWLWMRAFEACKGTTFSAQRYHSMLPRSVRVTKVNILSLLDSLQFLSLQPWRYLATVQ